MQALHIKQEVTLNLRGIRFSGNVVINGPKCRSETERRSEKWCEAGNQGGSEMSAEMGGPQEECSIGWAFGATC